MLFLNIFPHYISVFTYGSIFTSVMSLSSTAVDVLFLRTSGVGNAEIKIGSITNIKEDSILSYIVGVLLAAFLLICPKIIMYSWMIAMFSWRALAFFVVMAFIIFFSKIYRKLEAGKVEMNLLQLRKSFISTTSAMLSVESSPKSSMALLLLCSIFVITVLSGVIPNNNNETSLTFNGNLSSTFYQRDPENTLNFCICKKIDIEPHNWQNQYFNNGSVCQKLSTSNRIPELHLDNDTLSKCYDAIFFRIPFAFSVIPLEDFPAVTLCVTYDDIQNYITKLEWNQSLALQFDQTCEVNIKDIYVPCSDDILVTTKVVLSIMTIWMGCSLLVIILSKTIGKFLLSIADCMFYRRLF